MATAAKSKTTARAAKKGRIDTAIRRSLLSDTEHKNALATQQKVAKEVKAMIKGSACSRVILPNPDTFFPSRTLNGCLLFMTDGVLMKKNLQPASPSDHLIKESDVGFSLSAVLNGAPGSKLVPCTEGDMWELWADVLAGEAIRKRSAASRARDLTRGKDVRLLEKCLKQVHARYQRQIEAAKKTLPAAQKAAERAKIVAQAAGLLHQKASRKMSAAYKAEEQARQLKEAEDARAASAPQAAPQSNPTEELIKMLREARETIDTLPGYPKGAELCDKIDAFLGESKHSKKKAEPVKPVGQIAPIDKKSPA